MSEHNEKMVEENIKQMKNIYSRQDEVLELIADLGGRATPRMIYTHPGTDISKTRCYTALRKLDDRDHLQRPEKGVYDLTDAGEKRIEDIREQDLTKTYDSADDESCESR